MPNALVTEEERQRHLEHQKAYQTRWKARDPEGFRAYCAKHSRLYRERHPEVAARRSLNYHKRNREAILPPYARHLLAKEVQRSGVPCPSDILPPELVSAWADITKLRRLFAKKNQETERNREMKDIKLPKTLNQVRKELAKIYYTARVAQNRTQLETLRLMKDALRGQVQAAAIAISTARFEGRPLPKHWVKFIYGK